MATAGEPANLTPRLAFACALVYCAGADRELSQAEKSYLAIALSGPQGGLDLNARMEMALATLSAAMEFCREHTVGEYLEKSVPLLNADQRLTVLLNLVDMALADGHADANEAAFVHLCQRAFGITDEEF
ncbi:MAG: TerB family tellurite resistance protein, partial [Caulobacterales bacterium]